MVTVTACEQHWTVFYYFTIVSPNGFCTSLVTLPILSTALSLQNPPALLSLPLFPSCILILSLEPSFPIPTLSQIDANQDGMISMEEFLKYTEGPHFEDKDWEGIDNVDEIFSDEEFEDYMQDYANYGEVVRDDRWLCANELCVRGHYLFQCSQQQHA